MEATRSLSNSQDEPIYPRETIIDLLYFGTFFDNGEIFIWFYGKENLPDARKSSNGTKTIYFLLSFSFESDRGINFPINGNSTHISLTIQLLYKNFVSPLHAL